MDLRLSSQGEKIAFGIYGDLDVWTISKALKARAAARLRRQVANTPPLRLPVTIEVSYDKALQMAKQMDESAETEYDQGQFANANHLRLVALQIGNIANPAAQNVLPELNNDAAAEH